MRRKYEGVFIFLPTLGEEERNGFIDRIKGIVETDGQVTNIDEWGMRKLAYLIDDIGEGYYVLMNFESTPEHVEEMDRIIKISGNVMRHMIVREDE